MKNLLFYSLSLLICMQSFSQNWSTQCGSNERNGFSKLSGPHSVSEPYWTINDAMFTGSGLNAYTFGNRFAISRNSAGFASAAIECRNLENGELIWTSPFLGNESLLYIVGFNEDAVYAHDYHSQLYYALNVDDGSVKWVTDFTSYTFGLLDGIILTCDRDVILNGSLGSFQSVVCVYKETGQIRWENTNWHAVTPVRAKAAHGDRLYLIPGALNEPKRLTAVDINTGENLYFSEPLGGDGDQEYPIAVSNEGLIVFLRDGGMVHAFVDKGDEFDEVWTYDPRNMSLFTMNYSFDVDGHVILIDNGQVVRLDKENGATMATSLMSNLDNGQLVVGSDSVIYINNTSGSYFALSHDLQTTIWSIQNIGNNYFSLPVLAKEGVSLIYSAGTTITAYKNSSPHAPVADFYASTYQVNEGESVDFFDQSSFEATSWYWEFEGGNPATSTDQNPADVIYDEPGIYAVTLIASNDLGTDTITKDCYIEVDVATGLPSSELEITATIYPNPSNGRFAIKTEENTEVTIFSNHGEIVCYNHFGCDEIQLDLSHLPAGIYMARLNKEGLTFSRKLLIIK